MNEQHKLVAGTATTIFSWFAWLGAHLAEVDQWLQFGVLCLGLVAGFYTVRNARKAR